MGNIYKKSGTYIFTFPNVGLRHSSRWKTIGSSLSFIFAFVRSGGRLFVSRCRMMI